MALTLIVRIFFVGLIAFTPTDDEPGKNWLALLVDAQDEYGVATHPPTLHYCDYVEQPADRCSTSALRNVDLVNQRLSFSVDPEHELSPLEPVTYRFCNPDRLQAPDNPHCAADYRWIPGVDRTLGRDKTKRRWCDRDWRMLRACNTLSHVILKHGRLQNCRFVEGGPPTLPTRAIYGLVGLRDDGRSRVASEVSMVKIEVPDWQEGHRFVLHRSRLLDGLPADLGKEPPIRLQGTPCGTRQRCIDILIDNRPTHGDGQTHRPLIADHFDLYRRVWGPPGEKVQPQLNEAFQVSLDLQPCREDESPLLAGELVLGGGNERPICPQNTGN